MPTESACYSNTNVEASHENASPLTPGPHLHHHQASYKSTHLVSHHCMVLFLQSRLLTYSTAFTPAIISSVSTPASISLLCPVFSCHQSAKEHYCHTHQTQQGVGVYSSVQLFMISRTLIIKS